MGDWIITFMLATLVYVVYKLDGISKKMSDMSRRYDDVEIKPKEISEEESKEPIEK